MRLEPPIGGTRPAGSLRLSLAALSVPVAFAALVLSSAANRLEDYDNLRKWTDEQALPAVRVLSPKQDSGHAQIDLPARLEAYASAPIHARVSGYLKSWDRDIGANVKAGELLAEIDTPDLDQQLLQAEASVADADANANLAILTAQRSRSLLTTEYVSRQTADQDEANRTARLAQLAAAKANLQFLAVQKSYARIVAPFDGRVTARNVDVGMLVAAGATNLAPLFEISDTGKLRVYVRVPQVYSPHIEIGDEATLSVPEYPGEAFTAHVSADAKSIDPVSGATLVQLIVDNADGRLLPGGYAHLRLSLKQGTSGMRVPAESVVFGSGGLRVAALGANDRVSFRTVTILRDEGDSVVLGSGLNLGDRILANPPDGLNDGDPVQIVEDANPREGERQGR